VFLQFLGCEMRRFCGFYTTMLNIVLQWFFVVFCGLWGMLIELSVATAPDPHFWNHSRVLRLNIAILRELARAVLVALHFLQLF
jgi:hypothetical protein